MSEHHQSCTVPSRADARRMQILSAAAHCFCKHGFHGASIALISKKAGMSSGHIYHYFENKEAIIAAIVEQDQQEIIALLDHVCDQEDVIDAILAQIEEGISHTIDAEHVALHVEILAEAARNPCIATIIHDAHEKTFESIYKTLRSVPNLQHQPDHVLSSIIQTIGTLFEGLMLSSIRNPHFNAAAIAPLFRKIIHELISNPSAP